MAFGILNTFLKRIEKLDLLTLKKSLFNEMIQYNLVRNDYKPDTMKTDNHERPPMLEIQAYLEKFGKDRAMD